MSRRRMAGEVTHRHHNQTGYHMFCLDPPLSVVPKGQWYCHICLFDTGGDYGFDEGEDHSLHSFQERDLAFRTAWFEAHPPEPSTWDGPRSTKLGSVTVTEDDVEREFWRLVESPLETVEIEYGADVHSTTHGRFVIPKASSSAITHTFLSALVRPWKLIPLIRTHAMVGT